jgi:hypothetical protein
VQQLINRIQAPPFNGVGHQYGSWRGNNGETIHAMVNMVGLAPIIRAWVESPMGGVQLSRSTGHIFFESGLLYWWFPISEQEYPLYVHVAGELLGVLRNTTEGLPIDSVLFSTLSNLEGQKIHVESSEYGRVYQSSMYTEFDRHKNILNLGDGSQLDYAVASPFSGSSFYSGWMRLYAQVCLGAGRLINVNLFAGQGHKALIFSPNNVPWFVGTSWTNGFAWQRGKFEGDGQRLFTLAMQAFPSADWVNDVNARMAFCAALQLLIPDPASSVQWDLDFISDVAAAGQPPSLHSWQWNRACNQAAILVSKHKAEGHYRTHSVFTVDILWDETDEPIFSAPALVEQADMRIHPSYYLLYYSFWTGGTSYLISPVLPNPSYPDSSFVDFTDDVPVHLYYDLANDGLQIIHYYPYLKTVTREASVSDDNSGMTSDSTRSVIRLGEQWEVTGGFFSRKTSGRFYGSEVRESYWTVSGGEKLDVVSTNTPITTAYVGPEGFSLIRDQFIEARDDGATGFTRYYTNYVAYKSSEIIGDIDITSKEALVISAYDPTVVFYVERAYQQNYPSSWYTFEATNDGIGNYAKVRWDITTAGGTTLTLEEDYPKSWWQGGAPVQTSYTTDSGGITLEYKNAFMRFGTHDRAFSVSSVEELFSYSLAGNNSINATKYRGFLSAGNIASWNLPGVGYGNDQGYSQNLIPRYPAFGLWIGAA